MKLTPHLIRTTALFTLTGVLGTVHAADVIKIGEINSYKAQPAFLEPYKKGMELAIAEINAGGAGWARRSS
jgi:branched-chain amino acid transport system substrate-binding protein